MVIEFSIYQDCFSTAAMRGVWSEDATIAAWLEAEQALASCQSELGQIPVGASEAIGRIRLSDLDRDALTQDMMLVGRPIVGLVAQMRKLTDEHAPFVHFKSTTQDIMDTGMALQMKRGLAEVRQQTFDVIACIDSHSEAQADTQILARTNGQHAVPMPFKTKLQVWETELKRRLEALDQAAARGLNVQVGGPAGDLRDYDPGVALAVKQALAARLGLGVLEPHWQNARDGIADVLSAMGILCASLEKIAQNINLLSSSEIAEASERRTPGKGASSSMGHKQNQRASEFGEAVARLARQRALQITEHMMHQHERSGGVWIGEWVIVPEVFVLTSGALKWSNQMFSDLVFDADAMQSRIAAYERALSAPSRPEGHQG